MSASEKDEIEEVLGVIQGPGADVIEEDEDQGPEVVQTGVEVGPGFQEAQASEEQVGIELGDLVEFHSTKADLETVRGRVYYIDESRISILAEGFSRKLVVFDMEQDEDEDWVFLPEYELTGAEIKEKRMLPSFLAQRGMAKDMQVETFTAEGDPLTTYTITMVDELKDTAELTDEAGEVLKLAFEFKGIPRDRSEIPFDVLRVVEPPKVEPVVPDNAPIGEVQEDTYDFEFLDDLEAPDDGPIFGLFTAKEVPAWDRLYQDDDQINDMLRERIREMDPAAQKSTKRIRTVTRLVWNMLSLRNDIVRYSGDKPVGRKPVSFSTLVELLEKTEFPLAKKVLNVARAIYVDHSYGALQPISSPDYKTDPEMVPDPAILLYYIPDVLIKGDNYLTMQLSEGQANVNVPGAATRKIPRWITVWQGYFNKYFVTFTPLREDDDLKDVKYDQDFFRLEIPRDADEGETLSGLPVLLSGNDKMVDASSVGRVRYSFMRAVAARYGRYGDAGLTHKIEEADRAEIKGYLLFPLKYMRDLGYTRSGLIALDVVYGMMKMSPMKEILNDAGSISDLPAANRIISVNFDGSNLGNTEIADWLKGQAIYGGGIGNLMPYLRSFGLLQAEFTVSQKLVLDEKVNVYRLAVTKMLKDLRESIKKERLERKPLVTNSFLEKQRSFEMFKMITSDQTGEPILKELLADFNARHRSYAYYDVAKFAYLYVYYPDLLINTLAQNPEVAKERIRAERDLYMRGILDKLEEEKKLQDAGEPPHANPCQHVKDLNKIRRVPNNSERMLLLNKFVTMYKLKKEDHWLWCNSGEPPHHLICEHEYLLLQEFLRPREKDVIHKEIVLTFGGGKFNGQYICKQCGQAITNYEYDTNISSDDNGRPLDGRGVLVDENAIEEDALMRALTVEAEEEEKVETKSDEDERIFSTLNELGALVGIFPDRNSYEKMISRVRNALALVPDRMKYAASQRALKKAGKPSTDYDVFISRVLVSMCGAALLIDVQTKVPEYVIRYVLPSCTNPTFTGYPRDPDVSKPLTGMEYIACAISSITKRSPPWDLTGYQSIRETNARLKEIMFYLKTFTEQMAETPDVIQAILDKKQYLIETFGYESSLGRPKDLIPYGFTPAPFIVTKELAAEAEAPTIAESASDEEKVRAYIKQAHIYALTYGKYQSGKTFMESSCCYTNLKMPGDFWLSKGGMPSLPAPLPPRGSKGSMLYVPMTPRKLERIFGKADASIMYRLFIRVCFRGPRLGQQHEPGYDNVCPWCEFTFPEDPRLPPPARRFAKEGGKQKKYDDEYISAIQEKQNKELQALKEAGISEITKQNFEELLTEVNRRGILPPSDPLTIPEPIENLRGMLSILPAPFDDYEEVLRETLVAVSALPPDAKRTDLVNAFATLSNRAVALEDELRRRLGDANFANYAEFVKLPPQELGESLRTYFLVPFQRILRKTSQDMLSLTGVNLLMKTASGFGSEIVDDIKEAYKRHTSYLQEIVKDIPKSDKYIKAKMQEVVDKLSIVIPLFIKVLRPTVVRGGALASGFLQRIIVAGVFAEFVMPNHVPSNQPEVVAPTSAIAVPAKMPARILQACLLKYKQEGLAYSEEQIREMIQDRIEKEKALVMREKNELSPEGRKLDNMLQRLGMGKWAVGGTKAIWRYDPDQYVSEQDAMAAAGITRFGEQVDVYERDGGYDVIQTGEDDA
jgi:hypothetical protein